MSALISDEESRPDSESEWSLPVLFEDIEVFKALGTTRVSDTTVVSEPKSRATALLRGASLSQPGSSESQESVKTGYS